CSTKSFDSGEEFADADGSHLIDHHGQSSGLGVEIRFDQGDDAGAFGDGCINVSRCTGPGHAGQRHFSFEVAHGHPGVTTGEAMLDKLTFDPGGRHALNVVVEVV